MPDHYLHMSYLSCSDGDRALHASPVPNGMKIFIPRQHGAYVIKMLAHLFP